MCAEFFGAGEFFFFAEALPEFDFNAAWGDFGDLLEDVGFDGDGGAVERGTDADVGHGTPGTGFAFEQSAGDVDAASGEEFLLGREIQGGEGEAAARAGARDDFAGEDKGAAEKASRVGHVAGGDFATNERAGDDLGVVNNLGNDNHVKAAFGAEPAKQGGVPGLFVAEAEILADENGADLEIVHKNLLDEFLWGEPGESVGEGKNDGGFHVEVREGTQALVLRGKTERRGLRAENFLWRRIERQDSGDGVDVTGAGDGGAVDGLVAKMDAVKIADGDGAAARGRSIMRGPILRRRESAELERFCRSGVGRTVHFG